MKKIVMIIAALLLCAQVFSQEINVMSYNIRMGEAKDGTNSWELRYPATFYMLDDQKPDVFGVQEAYDYQVEFILESFDKTYKAVGVGREDGKSKGEHMSIFYNKNVISLLKWGTFWLSETPEVPSLGWDAACIRTATWALMKHKKSGKKFYMVNTHLDHVGVEARKQGLLLISSRLAEINKEGYPLVLTGDFNVLKTDPSIQVIMEKMKSAREYAETSDDLGSYNGWGHASDQIDYIFYDGFSSCPKFETVTKSYCNRKFVSDHFPVRATLCF